MSASLDVDLIYPDDNWTGIITEIRRTLDAAHNPQLLPDHFLKVVLPKLSGALICITAEGVPIGYGFLFPRRPHHTQRAYTLRYHSLPSASTTDKDVVIAKTETLLGAHCTFYDPSGPLHYTESHQAIGNLDFGHPGVHEVAALRHLQQQIWNNPPEALYPIDIHSIEFGLATSLVARVDGETVAFLFGFYKFGASLPSVWLDRLQTHLCIESQTMGVSPTHRGKRIGYTLKCLQAKEAQRQGIDIINWTVDPLQYPNAALNFSHLRGVAYEFFPNLYELHNKLNQVAASRFSLTWLVGSERVRNAHENPVRTGIVRLDAFPEIVRVNAGWQTIHLDVDAPIIAVEIPDNWSLLQSQDLAEAWRWRDATDQILAYYVGKDPGQYIITAAGADGERRYLIGERVDEALLERLVR
jgi:predicted GNAT superfamily acetyltransferase